MKIDIDQLSEAELIDLNHCIVARLRLLRQIETQSSMLEFRIGERVTFHPDGRPSVTGMITLRAHEMSRERACRGARPGSQE